jgi:hypothetical protein
MVRAIVGLWWAWTVAAPALGAQAGGGFPPGDLVLYSPAVQGLGSNDGALLRIDPTTGQVTLLVDLFQTLHKTGAVTYDPFRDRVLFCGGFTGPGLPTGLYAVDAAGNTQSLGFTGTTLYAMAPASGGRVYLRNATPGAAPIQYLDAGNQLKTLREPSGAAWAPAGGPALSCMAYDPGTNALFLAYASNTSSQCSGGDPKRATVWRVPLSLDGSEILGIEDCVQVAPDPDGNNDPVGWSRASGGKLLLVLDTNINVQQPRLQLLDPTTIAFAPFAWNSGASSNTVNAGTWSSSLGKAVVLDTSDNVLRAFAPGEVGAGSVIVPSSPISSSGHSERATLVEVAPGECAALVGFYCTAKTTSAGCVPALSSSGSPSASAGAGFTLRVDLVEPLNVGLFFYGHHGPAALAFQGGTLCVQAPLWRTPAQVSGGVGACWGSYSLDFNAYAAVAPDPLLQSGATLHGQFWFRDPPEPISATGLSSAIAFTLCP